MNHPIGEVTSFQVYHSLSDYLRGQKFNLPQTFMLSNDGESGMDVVLDNNLIETGE